MSDYFIILGVGAIWGIFFSLVSFRSYKKGVTEGYSAGYDDGFHEGEGWEKVEENKKEGTKTWRKKIDE